MKSLSVLVNYAFIVHVEVADFLNRFFIKRSESKTGIKSSEGGTTGRPIGEAQTLIPQGWSPPLSAWPINSVVNSSQPNGRIDNYLQFVPNRTLGSGIQFSFL